MAWPGHIAHWVGRFQGGGLCDWQIQRKATILAGTAREGALRLAATVIACSHFRILTFIHATTCHELQAAISE
jgi:hypothetical protein